MKKKIVGVLLVAAVASTLTGCGEDPKEVTLGTWVQVDQDPMAFPNVLTAKAHGHFNASSVARYKVVEDVLRKTPTTLNYEWAGWDNDKNALVTNDGPLSLSDDMKTMTYKQNKYQKLTDPQFKELIEKVKATKAKCATLEQDYQAGVKHVMDTEKSSFIRRDAALKKSAG